MKKLFFLIVSAVCLASCCLAPKYSNRAEAIAAQMHDPHSKYVVVACHRGDWRNFPENSAMAIESIIKMGADIMELDLKMTKDSVLVLSHDKTIDRCTTGKGKVSDYTYEELMQFNLKRAHGVKSDTTHILTLEQALSICKDRICVNVDQGDGNDDDAAYISGDPDSVYKRYLDLGVSMIQTDRPELLIGYLEKHGRHTLK